MAKGPNSRHSVGLSSSGFAGGGGGCAIIGGRTAAAVAAAAAVATAPTGPSIVVGIGVGVGVGVMETRTGVLSAAACGLSMPTPGRSWPGSAIGGPDREATWASRTAARAKGSAGCKPDGGNMETLTIRWRVMDVFAGRPRRPN